VLGTKLAEIGPLHVESGIFAFLQLVIISSAVAEVHGKQVADALVRYGFIPLILSMVMITIVIAIPHASFWSQQEAFASLLGQGARMQLAGLISYGTSQTLNVYVFSKMKDGEISGSWGSAVWLRGLIAALLSQAVDTLWRLDADLGHHDGADHRQASPCRFGRAGPNYRSGPVYEIS
jgi:queuosine precursor transporter